MQVPPQPPVFVILFTILISAIVGLIVGVLVNRYISNRNLDDARNSAEGIIENAKREADSLKKELLLNSKEENSRYRSKIEDELHSRRVVLVEQETRLNNREEKVDRRETLLEKKEEQLARLEERVEDEQQKVVELRDEAKKLVEAQQHKFNEIAQLSPDEAKTIIMTRLKDELVRERAQMVRESESRTRIEAKRIAKEIVVQAIERSAADIVADVTVSVVNLPNEEMKGRIIGREGRNIRSFEALTGVDLVIDETPETVILSSFDPVRREIGRIALEKLIIDGRIHPGKIEEIVDKSQKEFDDHLRELGDQTIFDLGLHEMHPELIKLVGRLAYRTSYGQNVLSHSIQVALLTGTMAAELGEDEVMARRAGLLHDIGKSIDHETEGSHIEIGVELAKRFHEPEEVINTIASHHGDVEAKSVIAVLVAAADAVSAARPGARSESLDSYIRRLEKLESLVNEFKGVKQSYAIQAGREIRVIVSPAQVGDDDTVLLAREIKAKIEQELSYPGHIKVSVIREFRAVEIAS
ncbi:ribonuclease Y [Xylocopilactobacillus apicola]|uniref:Ribonuclease Y n=1 Tax=Xylocopilactobacillus apicola TaxID=2932184 RepID=A0AAU9DRX5_9LACO|nr:ribonuclease Y [Xylocopilactobacillus apicola]BDR57938.1 ribonuclease Y [Xylocopilactobacillus apicola]